MEYQPAFDFVEEVKRTASNDFHVGRVDADVLRGLMYEAINALSSIDILRRVIYYNTQVGDGPKELPAGVAGFYLIDEARNKFNPSLPPHLVHAILGSACEAGEKLALLADSLFTGKQFDYVNYVEEVEDGFYYDGLGLNECGMSMESAMRIVIEKLRKRYKGAGFTTEEANGRDHAEERALLEESTQRERMKPLPDTDIDGRERVQKASQTVKRLL